jgi:hypothetical protein
MLRGEQKAPVCTDGSVVKPGRKIEAVDSDGVDQLDNRSKETGEGGMVTGVVTVKRIRADENERKQGEKQTRIGTSKDKSQ